MHVRVVVVRMMRMVRVMMVRVVPVPPVVELPLVHGQWLVCPCCTAAAAAAGAPSQESQLEVVLARLRLGDIHRKAFVGRGDTQVALALIAIAAALTTSIHLLAITRRSNRV